MYKKIVSILLAAFVLAGQPLFFQPPAAEAAVVTRVKDIAKIQGVRSNQLVGYGIVVGLAGTGDSDKSPFTLQSVANMLKTFGVTFTVNSSQIKLKNAAAVMVTATLPPFASPAIR